MRVTRVAVVGESMLPALRPGDWLVVRRGAPPEVGDLVVVWQQDRRIVKRVAHRTAEGWWVESDNQEAAGRRDSWDFGAVPDGQVVGLVVARYWPLSRLSISASALSRRRAR